MAWQTLLVMFGFALVLSGCGGGDDKKPNTNPAELTSQSVTGDWSGKSSVLGVEVDFTSHLTFHFDADALNLRVDGQLSSKNLNATVNFSAIVHAGNKRVTTHLESKQPLPVPIPSCIYKESQNVPPVDLMKSTIKEQMKVRKPDGMDGDYRQWKFALPPSVAGASGSVSIALDDNNGFRKFYESVKAESNKTEVSAETTFAASDVKIAKPDAGLFTVPKAWEPCVPFPNMTAAVVMPELLLLESGFLESVVSLSTDLVAPSVPENEVAVVV